MFGIGVKRMGALESQLFVEAFERKYGPGRYDDQAAMMCSRWEGYLKDPNWHPYTYIEEGNSRRVVPNENDKRLRMLRRVYGRKLYNAVSTALMQIHEYNPSGGVPYCGIVEL
ncbi:factor of DNA methylation 1-like [Papaver somniferum]|uniref:factor of DNA methylation 1-like n=1 Tax=Papaver somniferum TaxID=3469 RepID=UPI000E6FC138|nr:factor of DNA methylation 1-like [Papaver somniferum]XP_026377314.1 factor of DNA methylation 1-like [Papaver somniferum]